MERCLQLAQNGGRNAAPNPMVGAVIVHNDRIIGEGYHRLYGEAHAEVNAVEAVKDKSLLSESTMYVSLEPCAHHGNTPPCADMIVKHQIPRVVIATRDPFEEVNGKGIERLQSNGVEVQLGLFEAEARWQNRRFFTFHEKNRPHIILKWAQTSDGFMDRDRGNDETPHINWITHPDTKKLVHTWRSENQAIMVGTNTVLNDNPELTVRGVGGVNPLRVVVDEQNQIPAKAKVWNDTAPTLAFVSEKNRQLPQHVEQVRIDFEKDSLPQIMEELKKRNIQSLFVEGGQQLLNSFIDAALWDEAYVITGKATFGKGLAAPIIPIPAGNHQHFGEDFIHYYLNRK